METVPAIAEAIRSLRRIKALEGLRDWAFEAVWQECSGGGKTLLDVYPVGFYRPKEGVPLLAAPELKGLVAPPEYEAPDEHPHIWEFYKMELPDVEWPDMEFEPDEDPEADPIPLRAGIVYPGRLELARQMAEGQRPLLPKVILWMYKNGYVPKNFEFEWAMNTDAGFCEDLREYDLLIYFGYDPIKGTYRIIRVQEKDASELLQGVVPIR